MCGWLRCVQMSVNEWTGGGSGLFVRVADTKGEKEDKFLRNIKDIQEFNYYAKQSVGHRDGISHWDTHVDSRTQAASGLAF